jgi:Rrf2 family transcriptional regulator, iron-sulfur cluster assembly transcription factor
MAMIYSLSCRYGIRALTQLAGIAPNGAFCLLRQIVNADELPSHFVGKVLQDLVRSQILRSARGRGGGFALRRSPQDIRLREIVEAIDGARIEPPCFLGLSSCTRHPQPEAHTRCTQLRRHVDELLDRTTLADLALAGAA